MPSSGEAKAEQQRRRRECARDARRRATMPASTAAPERPPRLHADFKGEAGRFQYERARAQWFSQFMLNVPGAPKELPTFDEIAAHAIQRAQIAAELHWDKAFRAYHHRAST